MSHYNIKLRFRSDFVVSVDMIGLIFMDAVGIGELENQHVVIHSVVSVENPESTPVYELNFTKNRRGNKGVFYFDGDRFVCTKFIDTKCLDKMVPVAKMAVENYHKGEHVSHIKEHIDPSDIKDKRLINVTVPDEIKFIY